jgi:hypothetical protein
MKQIILVVLCIVLITGSVQAQKDKSGSENTGPASKAVYGELGGSGFLFSANFDSRFKGSKGLGFRIGIGGAGGTGGGILTIPFGLNALTGNGPNYFEGGITATFITGDISLSDNNAGSWFVLPHIGYRYSKPTKSFNGRIYVGPFITSDFVFFPFGGVSVGFTL